MSDPPFWTKQELVNLIRAIICGLLYEFCKLWARVWLSCFIALASWTIRFVAVAAGAGLSLYLTPANVRPLGVQLMLVFWVEPFGPTGPSWGRLTVAGGLSLVLWWVVLDQTGHFTDPVLFDEWVCSPSDGRLASIVKAFFRPVVEEVQKIRLEGELRQREEVRQ